MICLATLLQQSSSAYIFRDVKHALYAILPTTHTGLCMRILTNSSLPWLVQQLYTLYIKPQDRYI